MIARIRALASTNRGRAMIAIGIGLALALVLFVRSRLGGGASEAVPTGPQANAPGVVGAVPTGYAPDMTAAGIPPTGFDFAPNLAAIESEFDYALSGVTDRLGASAQSMNDAIADANAKLAEQLQRQREMNQAEIEKLQQQMLQPVAPVQTTGAGGGSTGPRPGGNQTATTGLPRWTPPGNIKVGDPTDISGAKFAGRAKLSNGQYAPIVKYANGTTQIHPEWQRWMAANKVTRA